MKGKARALRLAILSTIALILFAATFAVTVRDLSASWNAPDGGDLGVTFTFDTYTCRALAPGSSATSCAWYGTVSVDGKVQARDVWYHDIPPEDAQPGTTIYALWTTSDPGVAWNLENTRAWLSTVGSTILAGLGALAFLFLTILWWRRTAQEAAKEKSSAKAKPAAKDQEKELSHSSS